MLQRIRLSHVLVTLFLFTSITSAWPWPPSLKDMGIDGLIMRRQDDAKSNSSSTATAKTASVKTSAAASKTASPASSAKSAKVTGKESTSAKAKGTAKASGTGKASGTAAATSGPAAVTSVNPVLPAGGANMLTPAALAQTTYYKISDQVTFAWNYTSLSITPSKIEAIVTCSANSATYTLLNNATFEKTGSVVWDTLPDVTGTAPLLTESYTLVIYDAAKDPTARAGAGELGVNQQFRFGMYLKQSYTPLSNWKCAVCSAALSDTERQALKFMFGMCVVTVLSFTWFVSGLW